MTTASRAMSADATKRRRHKRSPKTRSRVYWRVRGGERRAYGDFRDLGHGRIPLVPEGDKRATTDPVLAEQIAAKKLAEMMAGKRDKEAGKREPCSLKQYAAYHLVCKAKSGKYSELWLEDSERMLNVAVEHFGADRDIATIEVADVQRYVDALRMRPTKRKRADEAPATLGAGTSHYLNALSSMYVRAISEKKVPLGHNPVEAMIDKPSGSPEEAKWLLVHEGALLLESARTYKPLRADIALPFTYPLVATFLLTAGRETEILGLEVNDIDFANSSVTFRPNQWRRLKTKKSHRTIPLWPQLATILKDYIKRAGIKTGLLFPSPFLDKPGMITDWRKQLDAITERTGHWKAGDVRSKMLRHSYCSARLMTVSGGEPVAVFTVSREMGHSSTKMVEGIYGHVKGLPHRSDVVEFRVEQHKAKLKQHLAHLRTATNLALVKSA
jgi:integrase